MSPERRLNRLWDQYNKARARRAFARDRDNPTRMRRATEEATEYAREINAIEQELGRVLTIFPALI